MKLKYRFAFREEDNIAVVEYLKGIKKKYDNSTVINVVEVFENTEEFEFIEKNVVRPGIIITPVYSKEEMEDADWYEVRSTWRWEYPKPNNDKADFIDITFNRPEVCPGEYCGIRQVDLFKINKEPDWKNRHFVMLNWVHGELFVKTETARFLLNSGLKGFEIKDVMLYKKNVLAENIKQIYVNSSLKPGLIVDEGIKQINTCEVCGSKRYITSGRPVHFKKEIFEGLDLDIIKTDEVFGIWSLNDRIIYISKRLYSILVDNKLDKNLEFLPLLFDN